MGSFKNPIAHRRDTTVAEKRNHLNHQATKGTKRFIVASRWCGGSAFSFICFYINE
jgi:hypothetical protein